MSTLRRTVLATAVISAGLLSSTGMAFAGDSSDGHSNGSGHHEGPTVQKGLINSSDFAPNTPINVCGNNVPVNGAGGQVPIQDNVLSLPFLSEAHHGNAASSSKTCANPISAVN